MVETRNLAKLAYRFENFIASVFVHLGFEVNGKPSLADRIPFLIDIEADFSIRSTLNFAVVEVKLYSSMAANSRSILQALEHLEHARTAAGAPLGILTTNSRIPPNQRFQIDRFPKLRVYDFDTLAALVAQVPRLALELEDISRSALVFRGEALPNPVPVDLEALLEELRVPSQLPQDSPYEEPVSPTPREGAQLCDAIRNAPSVDAKPFEVACDNAIRWLFEDELVAFDDQHKSHDGHNIFDLVARIASKEDFWQALITDFRARYIVFEFKNYAKRITQREIYTTEKYLYPIAMRGAAIVVSRHGADEGADQAMRGALRESGKLILSISVDELCTMLSARDAGSDHLVTLVDKLDAMLMGLER